MIDQRLLLDLEARYRALSANRDRLHEVVLGVGVARVVLATRDEDRTAHGLDRAFLTKALTDAAALVAATTTTALLDTARVNLLVDRPQTAAQTVTARAQLVALRAQQVVVRAQVFDEEGRLLARALSVFQPIPNVEAMDEEVAFQPVAPLFVWQTPFGPFFLN